MSDAPFSTRSRSSRIVALAVLSPALLAFSGCASRTPVNTSAGGSDANGSDCDANRSTPQTEDDCNRRRTGVGTGAGVVGGVLAGQALRNAAQRNAAQRNAARSAPATSPRGGFGGSGGFFSGGGS